MAEERFEQEPATAGLVAVHVEAHRTVVILTGEIDADLIAELDEATLDTSVSGLPIEVDVRGVRFMDSAGVTFLVSATRRSSHRVRVIGASEAVRSLLHITGVDQLVDLVDELTEADLALPERIGGGITLLEEPHATIARLWGAVNASSRDEASTALHRFLDRRLSIVLDTSRVTAIDSAGIAFLIQCHTIAGQEGLEVTVPYPPACVADGLTKFGAHDLIATKNHPHEPLAERPDCLRLGEETSRNL